MTLRSEAIAHLSKAEEFLSAAEMAAADGLFNAATSNAVTSGINSKDALCLALAGSTTKSDDHANAVAELKSAGGLAAEFANDLRRLLALKARSQYQARNVTSGDARKAIDRAARMTEGARRALRG